MMYCNDESNQNVLDETSYTDVSLSEIEVFDTTLEKQNDQCLDISYSDSNYVSEDSTICSEGLSEVKGEEEQEKFELDIDFSPTHNHDIDDQLDEIIDFTQMDTTGVSWLLDCPNGISNLEFSLNFSKLKMNVIIKNEYELLRQLQTIVETSNAVQYVKDSPERSIANRMMITSTPITNKLTRPSRHTNETFVRNDADNVDGNMYNVVLEHKPQNRTFVKLFYPIKSITDSLESNDIQIVSPVSMDHTLTEDMSVDSSPPMSENAVVKRSVPIHPKNRLSMIQTTVNVRRPLQRLSTAHGSITSLPTKAELQKPPSANYRQSMIEPIKNVALNNRQSMIEPIRGVANSIRKSSLVATREVLLTKSKEVRKSMVSMPRSTESAVNVAAKNAKPPPTKMAAPTTIPNFARKTAPIQAKPQIVRPTQLQPRNNNNLVPKQPVMSDHVPLVSPALSIDDNPLNRTFDKYQFNLLKSVTNTEIDIGDTLNNNNNNAIYRLAQAEQANLIKEVTNNERPRGLKLPSKIQSRTIPSLKK